MTIEELKAEVSMLKHAKFSVSVIVLVTFTLGGGR